MHVCMYVCKKTKQKKKSPTLSAFYFKLTKKFFQNYLTDVLYLFIYFNGIIMYAFL